MSDYRQMSNDALRVALRSLLESGAVVERPSSPEAEAELVERCARAMRDAEPTGYREHARAVLEAAGLIGDECHLP